MSLVTSTETATKVVKALILCEKVLDDDQRDLNVCLAFLKKILHGSCLIVCRSHHEWRLPLLISMFNIHLAIFYTPLQAFNISTACILKCKF